MRFVAGLVGCLSFVAVGLGAQAKLDSIWVSNSVANQLIEIDRQSGQVVTTVNTPTGRPVGVTVRANGDVWVAIQSLAQVLACDSSGNILGTFATGGGRPTGMGTDLAGNVWCGTLTGSFAKFDSNGNATQVPIPGTSSQNSMGDSQGNMWLGDGSTGNIYKVDGSNNILLSVNSRGHRTPAIDHRDNVYTSGFGSTMLAKWSNTGTALGTWAHGISSQQGLAIDANGDVWLANQSTSILKFDAGAQTFQSFTTGGNSLLAVGVDGIGNLWVCNFGSSSITEMRPNGTVVRTIMTGASPIPIGDNTGFQRAVFTDPFGDVDGDGLENNAEAAAGGNIFDPSVVPTSLTVTGNRLPGGTAIVTYTDTNGIAGQAYLMACSFSQGQIRIGRKRRLGIAVDDLFGLSVSQPAIFQNFFGLLDAAKTGVGTIQIPNIGALKNLPVFCIAITIDLAARQGIRAISPRVLFTIQ